MKIGVITAMSVEFEQLQRMMTDRKDITDVAVPYSTGYIGDKEIVLQQCGIGKVNAAMGVTQMLEHFHPDYVVSTGVAGGIDKVLGVMDVVVSSNIVYHDMWCGPGCEYGQVQGLPLYFQGDERLVQTALSLASDTQRIHAGLICTGDKFITDRTELDQIKENFPKGLAVDMESAAIAQVCHIMHTPFVSFRIISDTPGADEHIQQYENFWGEMADRSFHITRSFIESI